MAEDTIASASSSRKRPRTSPPPPSRAVPPPAPSSAVVAALPPAPSALPVPHEPLGTLPVHPPQHYTTLASTNPSTSAFQQPFHLTSFSYSPGRELLLDPARRDDALAIYREPRMGSDLNYGFQQAVWREGSVDEGLDALLDTLSDFAKNDSNPSTADDLLSKISLVTWRGMLTKLMLAVYEVDSVAQGRRADGWEMNAMVLDGCMYLEESNPPSKLAAKSASESRNALPSYYGYSFESYSTFPSPPSPPDGFEPPNTNVQWCSVVKTNLGGFRTIVGGEVDCVRPGADLRRLGTRDFIELKTNMSIQSQRDEVNFERHKLLKHYLQSFLLGVPTVTVGFRTRQGQLSGLQSFNTLEIPRLVRGKPHAWDPQACLASAQQLLSFIHRTLTTHPMVQSAEASFLSPSTSAAESAQPIPTYPVFRISFTPSSSALGPAGISVRELTDEEVRTEVLGAKKEREERVGFLLKRWVDKVRERRRTVQERACVIHTSQPFTRRHEVNLASILRATPATSAPVTIASSAAPAAPPGPPGGRRVPPPPPPPPAPASTTPTASAQSQPQAGGTASVAAGLKR